MSICSCSLLNSVKSTDKLYSYLIPQELEGKISCGMAVKVPFGKGNRTEDAIVFDVCENPVEKNRKLKAIDSITDELPVIYPDQLELCSTVSKRCSCTLGDALSLMIPSQCFKRRGTVVKYVRLSDCDKAREMLKNNAFRSIMHVKCLSFLLDLLDQGKDPITSEFEITTVTGCSKAQLVALRDKGLVLFENRREESDSSEFARRLQKDFETFDSDNQEDSSFSKRFEPNSEQQDAIDQICDENSSSSVYLLHGITGSGKTEVYLNCAEEYLRRGYGVLYLVPEISLTPQTISWITGRLKRNVAVIHSRLTPAEKYRQWDLIRRGIATIVVAPRSGIFAPIKNLKLIIIDEEHDTSYKSETHPRYNSKELAIARSKLTHAKVVLGSATPSIESYYASELGVYKKLSLSQRASKNAHLAQVNIIDMKEQLKLGAGEMLSIPLRQACAKAISENKQIILFLNRRGYSRTLVCTDCSEPVTCPSCSVGMTLHNMKHSSERVLVCHYCGYMIPTCQAECGNCHGKHFKRVGFGTQQLETLIHELYPNEKVLRMDQDTTSENGAHERILSEFRNGEASFLIGTQMIAKGHDFPNVTVVGILAADLMTNSADYRSSERAFQLITQASGRAGRSDFPGHVYIQTMNPQNAMIRYAASQDYVSFFNEELQYRRMLNLPPFKALGEIVLSLEDEDVLKTRADIVASYLRELINMQDASLDFELYGPMPAAIYELRDRYRMCFNIKAKNKSCLNYVFGCLLESFSPKEYPLSVDPDPLR